MGGTFTIGGFAMTFPGAAASVGYLNVPQNSQSTAYTTVLADSGKHILHPTADNNARTFTIDSNANVPYPVGTAITFVNEINTVTIAITSDTLVLAGAGTTGSRTLAAMSIATAIKKNEHKLDDQRDGADLSGAQQMLVGGGTYGPTLISAITTASLTANLRLCLDAGDASSYTSGTKWLDTSGNGYDFLLGSDGTTHAPTFVGSPGFRGSYWSFTGSEFFTYDTANEPWMQNLHKNNANWTAIFFAYKGSVNVSYFCGTAGASLPGMALVSNVPEVQVFNGSGLALQKTGATTPATGSNHMVGFSLNEATGAGGGFIYTDGNYNQVSGSDTFDATYTSPSAANAAFTMQLGAIGNGVNPPQSGNRLIGAAFWSTALTKANMDTLWAAMRGRLGI